MVWAWMHGKRMLSDHGFGHGCGNRSGVLDAEIGAAAKRGLFLSARALLSIPDSCQRDTYMEKSTRH